MLEGPRSRWSAIGSRLRRIERYELHKLRSWLENTRNLIHLSALLLVPVLIAAITALSNGVSTLPFLLFPPLASGTYTLFSEPNSKSASPRRFIGGLTLGALCGWVALEVTRYWRGVPPETFRVYAGAAAFAVFLTGAVTWLFDLEESQAFSTALLVLVTNPVDANVTVFGALPGRTSAALAYVLSVFVSTSLVAAAFVGWHRWFYERRARLLYASTTADDAVLVPMRGDHSEATAMLGARLAAAHDAGKVVLLNVVDDATVADAEESIAAERDEAGADAKTIAEERVGSDTADPLEAYAREIESATDVPCQVVVAAGDDDATIVLEAARAAECDLIVAPYEEDQGNGRPAPFVRELLRGDVDALVHRSADGRTDWRRILVPIARESDVAHAMIDFAIRLAKTAGSVSVCHCLRGSWHRDRRQAEAFLTHLVAPFDGTDHDASDDNAPVEIETRAVTATPESFVAEQAPRFDLALVGASTDRSRASRFLSPPTAERFADLECDLAIVSTARDGQRG
ncbi:HPP family protein [Natrialba sp. PRR66]|uniref:universal stress protein n=1 Tax=Natrialba sp. PRR66 TaxID=3098146 RepID=UPI002B1D253C|nr:HPP family protein [Natrialba sp. PRR66]